MSVHGWKRLPPLIKPSSCSRTMTPRSMYGERLCKMRADASVSFLKAEKSCKNSVAYSYQTCFSTKIGSQPEGVFTDNEMSKEDVGVVGVPKGSRLRHANAWLKSLRAFRGFSPPESPTPISAR
jgi:hypothetical protein